MTQIFALAHPKCLRICNMGNQEIMQSLGRGCWWSVSLASVYGVTKTKDGENLFAHYMHGQYCAFFLPCLSIQQKQIRLITLALLLQRTTVLVNIFKTYETELCSVAYKLSTHTKKYNCVHFVLNVIDQFIVHSYMDNEVHIET